MLFAGLPALQPIQGRDLSASWHDSSDLTTSSTPIVGADAPAFRSLVLLLPAAEDLDPPPPGSPEDLWAWFLERRLLTLPPEASPQRVQAVLGVVRVLEPRQAAPLVRSLFDKQPSLELAKLLHELGDEAGVPFLRAEFSKGADPRVRAAMALLELGIPEGFTGLQGPDTQRPILRRMHFQVVNAIEAYLKHPRATPEGREKALGFFFEWLDDAAYQPRSFAIIQRETGLDFGYGTARGMDDQERRAAALETCVRAARSWWQARSGEK
jgi:hypothetical protein